MSHDNVLSVEDDADDVENTGSNIWNYYKLIMLRANREAQRI